MLLPKSQSGKSIKTVLALYILLSVLSGGQTTAWEFSVPNIETQPADYSGLAEQMAMEASRQSLEKQLADAGVSAEVSFQQTEAGTKVECVAQDPERARQILEPLLDANAQLECIQGETENEQ